MCVTFVARNPICSSHPCPARPSSLTVRLQQFTIARPLLGRALYTLSLTNTMSKALRSLDTLWSNFAVLEADFRSDQKASPRR
eukprot:6201673-Pleurochrysis_carterae.AAC.3